MTLDSGADGTIDATTITDANGSYLFSNLTDGSYAVGEMVPAGWQLTYPLATFPANFPFGIYQPAIGMGGSIRQVPADYPTIQAAINAAASGDTVFVSAGMYVENIDLLGKSIVVTSALGPEVTIIDGNQAGPVVTLASGENSATVLNGFTLRNGRAKSSAPDFGNGGGIRISGSPTITNNKIVDNFACTGSGISAILSAATIQHNIISRNSQSDCFGGLGGGGITIQNKAASGSVQISENLISDNITGSSGGGISINGGGSVTVRGNIIRGNTSSWGGGIAMINDGFPAPRIVQNLIVENKASNGGGIYTVSNPEALTNNTIVDNDAPIGSGIDFRTFYVGNNVFNNIIGGKAGQSAVTCEFTDLAGAFAFKSNNVFNTGLAAPFGACTSQTGLNGNISVDPLFVDPASGDYHLRVGSRVIDVGNNSATALPTTDIDGNGRTLDGDGNGSATVDIGVDEFNPQNAIFILSAGQSQQGVNFGNKVLNRPPTITNNGGGDAASISVPENTKTVTDVNATDPNAEQTLYYSIVGGEDAVRFSIDATTGILAFISTPDFEFPSNGASKNNIYEVLVQVNDGYSIDRQTLTVTVVNVSEPPTITSNGGGDIANISINENAMNTTFIANVHATDSDKGQTLAYSIAGGADAGQFSINAASGVLTLATAPDFEKPADVDGNNVYEVIVQASDGELSDYQTLAVTITNVNEAPMITSNGGGATTSTSIPENSTVVTDVDAFDPDAGTTLTYSKSGGADSVRFAINSTTGVLTFLTAPNFEAPTDVGGNNVYDVIVRVSDGNLTATQTIAVTVGNVNEAPVITSNGGGTTASVSVAENSQTVTAVRGTDVDAGGPNLSYSISSGADVAKFAINSFNGALTFITAPDFEDPTDAGGNNIYDVVVSVSDGSLSDTQSIAVTVTDIAEVCSTVVVNTNDTGTGSLREAINCSNATPNLDRDGDGVPDSDEISFNIPGNGVKTISPATSLPTITDPVVIDGYTQPGTQANTNAIDDPDPSKRGFNGKLLIQLTGQQTILDGLVVIADDSVIRGLIVNGFLSNRIVLGGLRGTVEGSLIGTNAAGDASGQTRGSGIRVESSNNRIGGTTPASRNVLSGNFRDGLVLDGTAPHSNMIQGNFIGTDASGTKRVGNGAAGIYLNNADHNLIGGTQPGARNVVSGNGSFVNANGIDVFSGDFNTVQGNYVGVDVTGAKAMGNTQGGISASGTNTLVGGIIPEARNIVSGNQTGIGINDVNITVQGNYVGTDASGILPLGNTLNGIDASAISSGDSVIGGDVAGAGNLVAFNLGNGIRISEQWAAKGIAIRSNSIFQNGLLGIDLGASGMTPNDAVDADMGANNLQNFPVIESAKFGEARLTVRYSVASTKANSYYPLIVEFFKADADGEEGQVFLGMDFYLTPGEINSPTLAVPIGALAIGDRIVTTATDWNGNTSEFGSSLRVAFANQPPSGTDKTLQIPEDSRYTFQLSDFGFSDTLDSPGNNFRAVKVTTMPIAGSLSVDGIHAVQTGEIVSVASIVAGLFTYSSAEDSVGDELSRFTFQVQDDGGTAAGGIDLDPSPKTFVFDNIPVNDVPRAENDSAEVSEDLVVEIASANGVLANDTDADIGDTKTVVAVNGVAANVGQAITLASGARLVLRADGGYRYDPNSRYEALGAGQNNTDTFTYKVADGPGETATATVTISILGQNDAPVAGDDAFEARGEEARTILKSEYLTNDSDVDSSGLTGAVVDQPGHGSASLRLDGSFVYTPAAGFSGLDRFTYRVSDGLASSNVATISLNVAAVNHRPVVVLGGDVSLSEGQFFGVNGSFGDPDSGESWTALVNYGDGSGEQPLKLETNKAFQVGHTYAENGNYLVTVSVRDSSGLTGSASFRAIVSNVAPQNMAWSGPQLATRGQSLKFAGGFSDPGTADTQAATVDWGDRSSATATVTKTGSAWQVNALHVYASGGIFQTTLTIKDDDGGSAAQATTVMVVGARVNGSTFELVGSAQRDSIKLSIKGNALLVSGSLGNTKIAQAFPLAGVQTIVAYLGEGNDTLTVDAKVKFSLLVNAGGGNDVIQAGGGAAVLIGGLGQDQLTGGGKSDLLIAGTTAYDIRPTALAAILAEWSSGRPLATRIENLRSGVGPVLDGLNIALKAKETVFDDTAIDKLLGGGDLDWYWSDLKKDKITGKVTGEAVN